MIFPEIIPSALRTLIYLSACYCWVFIHMFIQLKTGNKETSYLNFPFCETEKFMWNWKIDVNGEELCNLFSLWVKILRNETIKSINIGYNSFIWVHLNKIVLKINGEELTCIVRAFNSVSFLGYGGFLRRPFKSFAHISE